MQQQLWQWGNMQRKLRLSAEVMLKPLHAKLLMGSATWSPCGQWVALEQLEPCSQLVVWDTVDNVAQEFTTLPNGCFLKVAWLPASAWLLYIKTHMTKHRFSKQSMFCHNMASGEEQKLLNKPHSYWQGKPVPVIAPPGHVLAYVLRARVVLLHCPAWGATKPSPELHVVNQK